jgi:hypothetical protein
MEHVLDLADAVARLRAILAPGGLVYVEVPDAKRYVDCLVAPFQDFNTEHINHFCPETLSNLMVANGFKLVAEGGKTMEGAGGTPYPACFGFFQLGPGLQSARRRAPEFQPAIAEYIARSAAMLAAIDAKLAVFTERPVLVWGAGQLTLKLLAETRLATADIVAFTDGNPVYHGKTLRGRPIISPHRVKELPPLPIILGTLLHHAAIEQRIRGELCLSNPVVTLA